MIFRPFLLLSLCLLLPSCGGVTYYQHKKLQSRQSVELSPIELAPGQRIKVLRHRRGLIWGGYIEGLFVEDPSIAQVSYGNPPNGDRFDSKIYLLGLKPGQTRAAYGNRLSESPFSAAREPRQVFSVHVR